MADTPAVVPALHLPVQSGSDAVLRRMKRQYTRAEYLDLVASLRDAIPDLALSTDVIVGFPGETDDDFAATLSLLEEVRFARSLLVHVLASPADRRAPLGARRHATGGVAAASRASWRSSRRSSGELNRELEGRTLEVLVEGLDRKRRISSGRSRCNRVVNIAGESAAAAGHARERADRAGLSEFAARKNRENRRGRFS